MGLRSKVEDGILEEWRLPRCPAVNDLIRMIWQGRTTDAATRLIGFLKGDEKATEVSGRLLARPGSTPAR